jgi:hypothetical protein
MLPSRSLYSVSRSLYSVTRSLYSVSRSLYSVSRSLYSVGRSFFSVSGSLYRALLRMCAMLPSLPDSGACSAMESLKMGLRLFWTVFPRT